MDATNQIISNVWKTAIFLLFFLFLARSVNAQVQNGWTPNDSVRLTKMLKGEMPIHIDDAFKKVVRKNINTNKEIMVTNTSCNIVDFATFKEEIIRNNFKIIECYISSDIPNFDKCMCAVISKQE